MEQVVVSGFSEQKRPEPKICPLRALAYTIAGIPAKVQEPLCIGPRCAWFIPVDDVEVGDVEADSNKARNTCYESQLIGRCSFIDFNRSECRVSRGSVKRGHFYCNECGERLNSEDEAVQHFVEAHRDVLLAMFILVEEADAQ